MNDPASHVVRVHPGNHEGLQIDHPVRTDISLLSHTLQLRTLNHATREARLRVCPAKFDEPDCPAIDRRRSGDGVPTLRPTWLTAYSPWAESSRCTAKFDKGLPLGFTERPPAMAWTPNTGDLPLWNGEGTLINRSRLPT